MTTTAELAPFRVWVVGGVGYWSTAGMYQLLSAIQQRFAPRPLVVICAVNSGATLLAKSWAISDTRENVTWQDGPGGAKPDLCLAFPGAEADVERARAHGVKVFEVAAA